MQNLLIFLGVWNAITFLITGYDKLIAGKRMRRIPEKTLFLMAACLGAPGVYAAMQLLRHKTLHKKFKYGIPSLICLNIAIVYLLITKLQLA